ncbi:MAG TPA: S-methyl-5'-thioadenosine phosphorylase [Candidatus Polarisedimenticolaceae bacterium]|nr:S-methyl-5'-thioadenosine phosphorylase [Candidatus Polarisedimenticolaceae bacterium]
MSSAEPTRIAIIGGSGLYELAGLDEVGERVIETPFGAHSPGLFVGRLEDRPVAFLARHGRAHRLLPAEINYRANIFALKTLGVERIVSASAVGSMRTGIRPQDVVLVDQFIDRGQHRQATFFGDGVVAHISFADPVCPELRAALTGIAGRLGARAHDGGTYLCIEGPAFSTRAESRLYRSWGVDVIGMTNMHEAKLAREAEICYATMALVTDYDCWHDGEDDVSVAALLDNLRANGELAAGVVRQAVRSMPVERSACGCSTALEHAILTPPGSIPHGTLRRLEPILGKYVRVP